MSLPKPLPGLLSASFRGIGFFVPELSSEAGRRVAAHYFPGLDTSAYDDHGLHPESLSVEAFYAGDDYIAHGLALRQAFETPGPATLVHPWWGAIRVILTKPAEITYSAAELRVVRFRATFERVTEAGLAGIFRMASGPALIAAGLELAAGALAMIESVRSNSLTRLLHDATARVAGSYLAAWNAVPGAGGSTIRALLPQIIPTGPVKFAGLFNTVNRALVDLTIDSRAQSAVAPAADAPASQPLLTAGQALDIASQVSSALITGSGDAVSATDQAIFAAAAGDLLGMAAGLVADTEPASRRDALAVRQQVTALLDAFSNTLQSLFETAFAGAASRLYRSSLDVRLLAVTDINEIIGRLPQTAILTLTRDADAWGIANMLYGDNPQTIEAGYHDLVRRNRLRHPAMIPPGLLEILP